MRHTIRTKDGGSVVVDNYGRSIAIKLFCTECGGHGEMHPKECPDPMCALYPYRGKKTAGYHSDEK